MFDISHEVPISLLEKSREFNDYDYALVHLFDKHPEYYKFFEQSLEMGRKVILDNSAYELGHPYEKKAYMKWVTKLSPTEYILPDYRGDSELNLEAIIDWDSGQKNSMYGKQIGVVHGENYNAFCKNYNDIKDKVSKIAFAFEPFFNNIAQLQGALLSEGRELVIKMMLRDNIIDKTLPHHILGTLSTTEFQSYSSYDWMKQ